MRKDQHKKYRAQQGLAYDIVANKSRNTQPDQYDIEPNHWWRSGTCVVVGDSMVFGIDQRRLSKNNGLVRVRDFRGFTITDLKHHYSDYEKRTRYHYPSHRNQWCYF